MTFVLFFVIGLSGGAAQFASKDLCEAAGKHMKQTFNPTPIDMSGNMILGIAHPNVEWFCIESGFRTPQ